jgi:serine/threonine protein kinase
LAFRHLSRTSRLALGKIAPCLTSPRRSQRPFCRDYRIQRELGAGGMATVYLAHDIRHERDVAIKVLTRDLAAVIGADRFIAEIRTTAHLRHPHILPLFDSGAADGLPFYVMPLVDGESLLSRLRQGPLPIAEAVGILREVADALAHAHASGIIHRDVKPDNVLLSGRHVFLADFSVARAVEAHLTDDQTVTGTSVMVGTPAYMAPEQVTTASVDHRSDIYAFGVMAYELLTGAPPFQGTHQEIVTAHLTASPVPLTTLRPETPAPLASAVMQCLHKRPDQRWQRIDDMVPVLEGKRANIWSVPLPKGRIASVREAQQVTFGTEKIEKIAISWDGSWLAYDSDRDGQANVWKMPLAGGTPEQVTHGPNNKFVNDWSPDGQEIVYHSWRRASGPCRPTVGSHACW